MEAGGSFYCFVARGRRARRNERRSEMSKHDQREAGGRQPEARQARVHTRRRDSTADHAHYCPRSHRKRLPCQCQSQTLRCVVHVACLQVASCLMLGAAWSAPQIIIYI